MQIDDLSADTNSLFTVSTVSAGQPTPPQHVQYDLTSLVVPLLKSVLYRDEDSAMWAALLTLQARGAGLRCGAGTRVGFGRGGGLCISALSSRNG